MQEVVDTHILHNDLAKFQPDHEEMNLASMLETLNPDSYIWATLSDLNEVVDHQEHLEHVLVLGSRCHVAKTNLANEDFVSQSNLYFWPPLNFLHYQVPLLTIIS